MTGGILVLVIIVLFLAAAGLVADALARTLGLYGQPLKPRVRTADANPGGPPLIPASGAARRRPGSAGLPAIDPATLAHLRRRMAGLPARTHGAPRTGWALAPVLYDRGANPYPADTIADMPAVENRPRVHPGYLAWERKQAEEGWFR